MAVIAGLVLRFVFSATSAASQDIPFYHFNRIFTSAEFNARANMSTNLPEGETEYQPGMVRGAPVKIDTNKTVAIERQAIVFGCESAMGAWNSATNMVVERRYPGKTFDNTGWICASKSFKGKWGAYLWTLQNSNVFQSSATNWWEIKEGMRVPITNVIVGSLGNYQPITNVVDVGPDIGTTTNFPGADKASEGIYRVDLTNVFYQLMIPYIRITPPKAMAATGSTNPIQFTITATNVPGGVEWKLRPDGLAGGAVLQVSNDWHFAGVTPGAIVTNYKIRVTSMDVTNFYAEAKLDVIKVDIVESNLYLDVTNIAHLHLTPDSATDTQWEIKPAVKSGARFDGKATGTNVVLIAGSAATNYTVKAYAAQLTNCFDVCTVTVVNAFIVPDRNHDRIIDASDKGEAASSKPFRFWANDDADGGNTSQSGSDLPGQAAARFGGANYADDHVNGNGDLLDFFPVWLDLKQTLDLLPPGKSIQYKLRQDDAALKAVYTDLTRELAGAYLTMGGSIYGPSFKQNASCADTFAVTTSGVALAETFLNKIKKDKSRGILMIEGAKPTQKPLVLEILKDGRKIHEKELPLSIDGVEKMYRWINLRNAAGGNVGRATDVNEPSNYPDNSSNRKQFVFVHGYSVSEEGARAWNAEMFKRLYQSGSRAMFTALTWFGNEGQIFEGAFRFFGRSAPTPNYYANVVNAFESAPGLASMANGLPGRKYVAGHSLGNMVVSCAIKNHGLRVGTYFMLNAAVAMEAYDRKEIERDRMRNPLWRDYRNRLWAAEWHRLFSDNDGRRTLTWRDRFSGIDALTYNYYSSSEDVLDNGDGRLHNTMAVHWAWYNQEVLKGMMPTWLVAGYCEGGWEFNKGSLLMTPQTANHLPDDRIRTNSFFLCFDNDELYGTNGSAVAGKPEVRRKLLADAIPALSNPMGRNALGSFGTRNRDMSAFRRGAYRSGNWPDPDDRWRHSHIIEIAYPFNYAVFDQIVSDGGLR